MESNVCFYLAPLLHQVKMLMILIWRSKVLIPLYSSNFMEI